MCRYVLTEQFLGTTFVNLLEKNKYEIELSSFNEIGKMVDESIRIENNAILCISTHELYSTINEYQEFFSICKNSIIINSKKQSEILDKTNKEAFLRVLKLYFSAGLPQDINYTVNNTVKKFLMAE